MGVTAEVAVTEMLISKPLDLICLCLVVEAYNRRARAAYVSEVGEVGRGRRALPMCVV